METTTEYSVFRTFTTNDPKYKTKLETRSNASKIRAYDNRTLDTTGRYVLMQKNTDWIVCHATALNTEKQPVYANEENNPTVTSGADAIANPAGLTYVRLSQLTIR